MTAAPKLSNVYSFKQRRGGLDGVDPQVAMRALMMLANAGRLTAKGVVDAARRKAHPLHDYFEWDDTVAAEGFRCQQAAYLIRNVMVSIENVPNEVTRALVHIEDREADKETTIAVRSGHYLPIQDVLEDPVLRARLLERALLDLRAFEGKYGRLPELHAVFNAIHRVRRRTQRGR